jgi:hypothetical protein
MSGPTPTVEAESRAFVPFNVNEYVRVKLTERGVNILRRRHDRMADSFPNVGSFSEPKRDTEGWSSFQLWELMKNFGADIGNGLPVPFETTIEFGVAAAPSSATGTVSKDEIVSILKASLSNHDMAAQCILNLIALASPPPIAGPTKEEVAAVLKPFAEVADKAKGSDDACWCGQGGAVIRYRDLRAARDLLALFNGAGR